MSRDMLIVIFLCVFGLGLCVYVCVSFKKDFLTEFEKSCHETILRMNNEYEEKEKLYSDLRKWLFTK